MGNEELDTHCNVTHSPSPPIAPALTSHCTGNPANPVPPPAPPPPPPPPPPPLSPPPAPRLLLNESAGSGLQIATWRDCDWPGGKAVLERAVEVMREGGGEVKIGKPHVQRRPAGGREGGGSARVRDGGGMGMAGGKSGDVEVGAPHVQRRPWGVGGGGRDMVGVREGKEPACEGGSGWVRRWWRG
ncbi:unnamed protein product [Closterium sp. NIES-53]